MYIVSWSLKDKLGHNLYRLAYQRSAICTHRIYAIHKIARPIAIFNSEVMAKSGHYNK